MSGSFKYETNTWLTRIVLIVLVSHCPGLLAQNELKLFDFDNAQLPRLIRVNPDSTLTTVDHDVLNAKALEVNFDIGDSFGSFNPAGRDWSQFERLKLIAFNPSDAEFNITLTVFFRNQLLVNPPRVRHRITLSPGENRVSVALVEFIEKSNDTLNLTDVSSWSVSTSGESGTLYFSSLTLWADDSNQLEYDLAATSDTVVSDQVPSVSGGNFETNQDTDSATPVMPSFASPVMFDTPLADQIVSAMEIYPSDNPFNQEITDWPLHENSKAMIDRMGESDPLRYNTDMAYILVPPDYPRLAVAVTAYPDESDPGPYPVPDNLPIEGWPVTYAGELRNLLVPSLEEIQREGSGDRHAIVVDPINRMSFEFYRMYLTDDGWTAEQASIFDLSSNQLRPDGWTSADASGLPLFPAVVRYDELARGEINHALRVTFPVTRRAYVSPATHYASRSTDPDLPRMGERIRLRSDFDTSTFTPEVQTILRALKKYGMLVADNGINWAISVTPDPRIGILHQQLRRVRGSDFEVVVMPR